MTTSSIPHPSFKRGVPPVMRYHGGKHKLADWITSHFPPHDVYLEPFGGAAGVLFNKTPSRIEIYNDLDSEIVNVFRVLRNPRRALRLREMCELTPYARDEYALAQEPCEDPVEQARRTIFRAWASFGSAGATRGTSGMRMSSGSGTNHYSVAVAWRRIPEAMVRFTDRLRDVLIENRPAIEVMLSHDGRQTLHYIDPPYVPETRSLDSSRYYRHEMTLVEHEQLLKVCLQLEGYVVLSGYDNALYRDMLSGWMRVSRSSAVSGNGGSLTRMEHLWLNPRAAEHERQQDMFGGAS
ncbi:DNA adenine methylase [Billgrantia desiderata]|uniref:DNA adenine methylase n=1 Tax=Billgrantia desiderata TaxID=52021 RepID=UPI00089F1BA5|nr:DNA adenine methylase [Halomonas desiderata]SEG30778.1 DNA adenine methylase [Halomonas desiderata]